LRRRPERRAPGRSILGLTRRARPRQRWCLFDHLWVVLGDELQERFAANSVVISSSSLRWVIV
jgi:hypothetical protein